MRERAKALTKIWRTTMRPKPSREWVMATLEGHGIRVVDGRRGTSENAKSGGVAAAKRIIAAVPAPSGTGGTVFDGDSAIRATSASSGTSAPGNINANIVPLAAAGNLPGNGDGTKDAMVTTTPQDSLSVMAGARMPGSADETNRHTSLESLGVAASLISSGVSSSAAVGTGSAAAHLAGIGEEYRSGAALDLVSFLRDEIGFYDDDDDVATSSDVPEGTHRPLVGGGAAAAYEAARADHYRILAEKQRQGNTTPSRLPGTASGSSRFAGSLRHKYELLKCHQLQLLEEVQDTTMMMNLYQREMLRKKLQVNERDASLMHMTSQLEDKRQHPDQQQQQQQRQQQTNVSNKNTNQSAHSKTADEFEYLDAIRRLREEIAEKERKVQELAGHSGNADLTGLSGGVIKRQITNYHEPEQDAKRVKIQDGAMVSADS